MRVRWLGLFGGMFVTVASLTLAVAPRAAGPATVTTVTIAADQPRQRLDGFGAATAYYQNWITAHPNKKKLYDAFFKGLNLGILRLQNVYRPEKGADFAANDADIVRGAATSLGHPIPILLSSWAPPAALKSNHSEKNGGTLAQENGAFVYGKFAAYWADSLAAYRRTGIVPTYVSIQNEPDWKAEWESCIFKPTERIENGVAYAGYDRALAAVSDRLRTTPGGAPRMIGPEPLGLGGRSLLNYLPASNTAERSRLYAVAHHLYSGGTHLAPDSFVPALQAVHDAFPTQPKWMTEMGRSDGLQTAWLIHNCLTVEQSSAYIYWAAIWPGNDCLITIDNPWQRAKWKNPDGFAPTDRYYALKHYSYFTAPGYHRVDVRLADPTIKVSAFLSPDRTRLVLVGINTATTGAKTLRLDVRGFARDHATTAMYRTSFPATGGVGERFKHLGPLSERGALVLPSRTVTTVVFTSANRVSAASRLR